MAGNGQSPCAELPNQNRRRQVHGGCYEYQYLSKYRHPHRGRHLHRRGRAGADRPHHTDVDIPRRAGGDILVDTGIHSNLHAPDGACSDLAAPRTEAAFSGHRLDLLYVPRWQSMTARLSLAKCTKANGFFLRDSFLFRLYSDNLAW